MASVGVSTVSPYVLMQALDQARRRGNPGDYYGIGHALDTLQKSYLGLNKNVQDADKTFNDLAKTDARTASGYYPAQAGQDVAQFKNNEAKAQQQQLEMQDLQQAVNQARAQGLTPGTPQFYQFVQAHVNTLHGARNVQPEITAQAKQLQNQQMQKTYLEDQIKRQMALETAKEMYARTSASYTQNGKPLDPNSLEAKQLWIDAVKGAVDHVQSVGVKVDIDPVAGTITATDTLGPKAGQAHEIDPKYMATAMKIGGNDAGFAALQAVFNNERLGQATKNQTLATQGKTDLQEAQAAGGGGKAGTGTKSTTLKKGEIDPNHPQSFEMHMIELRLAHLKDIEDPAERAKERADIMKHIDLVRKSYSEQQIPLSTEHLRDDLPPNTDPNLQGTGPDLPSQYGNYGDTTGRVPGMDFASPPMANSYFSTTPDITPAPSGADYGIDYSQSPSPEAYGMTLPPAFYPVRPGSRFVGG
jgi:hypothetical protein